ncbi:MBL fold metallo-hydrolase [Cupriavidus necator]|uniref:MBL fold metallo-hydrolase n=1 Tax=Cupriavidus necator TaxID=106590 RepID=UPI0039C24A19
MNTLHSPSEPSLWQRALLVGGLLWSVMALPVHAAAPQVGTQAPGYYRMKLGKFEITALSDGTVNVPIGKLLKHASHKHIASLQARSYQSTEPETSVNAFLINTGQHLVLVDTGAGGLFGPGVGGKLPDNIRAAGYQPEQIDAVLLTHIHVDHSGGLAVDGKAVFPNAVVYVDRRDADFWLNPANAARAAAGQRHNFAQSEAVFAPYLKANKVRPFDGEQELFPGIRPVRMPGHTPGHAFYEISSEGQRLQLWGDTIHAQHVQFPEPGVAIDFDVDSTAAVKMRKRAMADAAANGYWVGAAHISFPGLGHVRRQGKGYAWVPAGYSMGREKAGAGVSH